MLLLIVVDMVAATRRDSGAIAVRVADVAVAAAVVVVVVAAAGASADVAESDTHAGFASDRQTVPSHRFSGSSVASDAGHERSNSVPYLLGIPHREWSYLAVVWQRLVLRAGSGS